MFVFNYFSTPLIDYSALIKKQSKVTTASAYGFAHKRLKSKKQ